MYSKNDILARLRKGEDMDAILDEMTKSLNEASQLFQEEKAAKEVEAAKRQEKRNDMRDVANALAYYLDNHTEVKEEVIKGLCNLSDEDLDRWSEQMESLMKMVGNVKRLEFKLPQSWGEWFW